MSQLGLAKPAFMLSGIGMRRGRPADVSMMMGAALLLHLEDG
jgi:hypothetical protein